MTDRNIRATAWAGFFLLSTALLASACDDSGSVTAPRAPAATLVGTVTRSDTGEPIANAEVSVGAEQVTTGPDGRFELAHLAAGPAVLWCTKLGFVDFKHPITLGAGRNDLAITLTYRTEVFEFGDFALYVPAEVDEPRGILVALGGPDTRGFASSAPFGAPLPEVEAALQALGQDFRTMALEQGIAILGTSQASMTNSASSDKSLFDAIRQAVEMSERPNLATAPVLLYGMSGGAPEAAGFTTRNPDWVAGLFLKVPESVQSPVGVSVLGVPTYVVLAELDAFVDNAALTLAFGTNRSAGALWALALERGVPHHSLSPAQRTLTVDWMSTILPLRVSWAESYWVVPPMDETSGWLGDPATGEVASWAAYTGDRSTAAWFPSGQTAQDWQSFVRASSP